MSWKPEVIVLEEPGRWLSNGLRFATEQEALDNARNLMGRWILVTKYRATECSDPVNSRWVGGELELELELVVS
jgi:hypothetical protein